jgi:DNA-directed RNA polymerase sigma subunit (sigma70/sigma32)
LFGSSDEETCLSNLLIDEEREEWQPMDRESLIYDLNRVLSKLDEDQIKLIKMCYGLD